VAAKAKLSISFAPVLGIGHAGSGMHQHISLVRNHVHLPNVVKTEQGFVLSPDTLAIVAGMLHTGAALMAAGNRVPGSFLRLTGGKECPSSVKWGFFNRGAMIRIPIQQGDGRTPPKTATPATVEYRLGDGSAFPHLLLAGIAQAICWGFTLPVAARAKLVLAGAATRSDEDLVPKNLGDAKDSTLGPAALPLTAVAVRDAFLPQAQVWEAGDVFPRALLQAMATNLEKQSAPTPSRL